ncbi:hypothetical protein E7744_07495 [Citricoccus sp. SGAir0253]|uniref:hypothetical protein n=1 Tax=Citricoccus sp. SGAir0253 TaxID=2567881 RepID=UPI0010CD0BAB|nr:hypothetical protein [Citricoccus sp. SGAir0253]QCU78047.1 hypothetical protein E7744_07495 [Citricoccus sp. SGAir0253]
MVDGVRYLKSTGLEADPPASMPPARLVGADDRWAAELVARQSRSALLTRLEDATEHLGGHPADREAALAVLEAARSYLAALDGEPAPEARPVPREARATGVPDAATAPEEHGRRP